MCPICEEEIYRVLPLLKKQSDIQLVHIVRTYLLNHNGIQYLSQIKIIRKILMNETPDAEFEMNPTIPIQDPDLLKKKFQNL